jgi:hypothetical protein
MVDYCRWIGRAILFVEGLRKLPGGIEVETQVAPALDEGAAGALAKALPQGLPGPLRRFLTQASAGCEFGYSWEPPQDLLEDLQKIVASKTFVFGGGCLCDATKFAYHQRAVLDFGLGLVEEYPEDSRLWVNSVPFLPVGNGDRLALYVGTDWEGEDHPVVYLDHEGYGFSCLIAPSFDQFLESWERLFYVGPLWLRYFIDPVSGHLNPDSKKQRLLQELLSQRKG